MGSLRLKGRLLTGFLAVALLVLVTGGVGVLMIERIKVTTDEVLEQKIPLQEDAMRLMLSVERSIALSRDYVLSMEKSHAAKIGQKIEAESIHSSELMERMDGVDLTQVTELFDQLTTAQHELIAAHDKRLPYWFHFDQKMLNLTGFLLQQRVALEEWLTGLEESVKFDTNYNGNLDVKQSVFQRWHSEYSVEDPKLKKMLGKYAKINKKIFKFADKVNKASGTRKISHFQRGKSRQILKAQKGLDKIIGYVTPIEELVVEQEHHTVNQINQIAENIGAAIEEVKAVLEADVNVSRQQVHSTERSAWLWLSIVALVSVVIAILIALYIARSVVNPMLQLQKVMSEVTGNGDFSRRMERQRDDEIGETADTFNQLLETLQGAISEIGQVMSASAEGDFSRRVASPLSGDLNNLKESINGSISRIQDAIGRVNGVMQAVESGDFEQRINEQFGGELQSFRNTVNGALNSLQQMTESLSRVMQAIVNGDFKYRMESVTGSESEIEREVNRAMESMEEVVGAVSRVMERTAEGDLTQSIEGTFSGQLSLLTDSVNHSLLNQRKIVGNVRGATQLIQNGVSEIARGNSSLAQRTTKQSASLEQTASSMEEISSTVKMNAGHAAQANQLASEARDQAEHGAEIVNDAVDAMGRINESSNKIAEIITLIDGIAFQTNLLALNAAVEAARAGDHGRGFAVVAGEVRTLAQRSADAAKDIKGLIEASAGRVSTGSDLVARSGHALQSIQVSVKKVNDIVSEISAASQEQTVGIGHVNESILELEAVNQQNSALVEEAAASSQSVDQQAAELSQLVGQFKLKKEDSAIEEEKLEHHSASGSRINSISGPNEVDKDIDAQTKSPQPALKSAPAATDEWNEF
ncbi:MAG: HAMP domain-containing protein [Gammaproteobacteria bacterium]|jgi:methyl-accepting chemotaxis protein|nr:HAMP domain-containing protein [Gammaproteobacteria bacterium]MBT3489150.1 HAMP domain-containing protein [Gammaproteobacteria bacterium]MBT3719353.1 HAMP domain-containing protein [Gammaproteobacteria bacterium]MBT3845339.1 HAMP domain-containing protein [Gammaproteobacteria bacterium]MBT3892499.1 HAMP domain-containing protein [Gammaproteobacteria bacterium]